MNTTGGDFAAPSVFGQLGPLVEVPRPAPRHRGLPPLVRIGGRFVVNGLALFAAAELGAYAVIGWFVRKPNT